MAPPPSTITHNQEHVYHNDYIMWMIKKLWIFSFSIPLHGYPICKLSDFSINITFNLFKIWQNILNIYLHSFLYMIMKFWLKWPLWTKQWHINCTTEWFHLNITWIEVYPTIIYKDTFWQILTSQFIWESVYTVNTVTEVVTSSTIGPRLVMIPLDTVSGLVVLVESRDDCLLTSGEAISTSWDATSFSIWYQIFLLLMKIIPAQWKTRTPTLFPSFPPQNSTKS